VQGIAALAGLPMTSLLSALPPLMVVIAVATSIHLLTAVARTHERDSAARLVAAAQQVGPGCFWTTATTAVGFDSFLWSDLESFRHFGGLAALGVAIAFLVTFTLLPALLVLHLRRPAVRSRARASALPDEILAALRDTLRRYPRSVLAACLGGFALLATGAPRLHYASDFGFGEQSFVVRSLRAIEANFRKPMTTEIVVTLRAGCTSTTRYRSDCSPASRRCSRRSRRPATPGASSTCSKTPIASIAGTRRELRRTGRGCAAHGGAGRVHRDRALVLEGSCR